jgi:hypothetical protein
MGMSVAGVLSAVRETITCEVIAAILDLADSGAVAEQDFL